MTSGWAARISSNATHLARVSRLSEERCAAAQLDQVWRQVPADQNGMRGVSDTPVRVRIVLHAYTILQQDGRRHRPLAPLYPRLVTPARELCDDTRGFRSFVEQYSHLLEVLIQVVQGPGIEVEHRIGRHTKRPGLMDAERARP